MGLICKLDLTLRLTIPLRLLRVLEHVHLAVLIIEESIMADKAPSALIRQISLKNTIRESENDHEVFYFGCGIFEVFEILWWWWGGEGKRRSRVQAAPDQLVYFRSFCSKWSRQLLKVTLFFLKRS